MALNPKQSRFVYEYLVDLNATQAAIRAGYSVATARSIGHENLTKPDIAAAISEAQRQRVTRTEISQDWVLSELRDTYHEAREHHQQGPALRALELMGKHLGMFTDRVDVQLLHTRTIELAAEYGIDPADIAEVEDIALKLLAAPK